MNFPHTATIQASIKAGTKYTYADAGTTRCFLQPLSDEETQLFGMAFSKSFRCYIPFATEVTESMRLIIDGDTYGVRGVRTHNYGSLAHKRAILERL